MNFSRLMLGTVQFGLNYGIANSAGQPDYDKSRDIIGAAFESGINCLDTAAAYGNSEEVIGKALHELGIADKVSVISKIPPVNGRSRREAEKFIVASILNSMSNLGKEFLDGCLFHREEDVKYMDLLLKARDNGLIKKAGISIDSDAFLGRVLDSGAECVQLPFNILDRRFTSSGFIRKAKSREMSIFCRSIYLQGLLLMQEDKIPESLRVVIPVRRKLESLAAGKGMEPSELYMRLVVSRKEIDSLVTGVDSLDQLQKNVQMFGKGPLDDETVSSIENIVPEFAEEIVRPCRWGEK
ncbi:MAG: aldo/keto reductase [Victivallales bacterium]|nr:aldo/keto reductase [Victivallales bacterium]